MNNVFNDVIQEYTVKEDYAELFTEVIADTYKSQNTTQVISRSELLKEINDLNSRVAKGRELLLMATLTVLIIKLSSRKTNIR